MAKTKDSDVHVPQTSETVLTGKKFDLVEMVNELQSKLAASGLTVDISLPQIVVVGCQSAGKSSVLENIAGKEFLPRGSGVVTRRPTIVQLQKSKNGSADYAEFSHKPGKRFKIFEHVREEIIKETLKDPGPDGFSSVPIILKIFSSNALILTLVDLPGLIRVTTDNQSEDSIEKVRNVVLQYISQPNSLILAVSPANQDISNSDALEIAKTVDPERVRTIGVLTKLDLMDAGTDARDILENKIVPLKRGYIGVLNRSQQDIEESKGFEHCLQKEKTFFASRLCYKHLADKMGTPYLTVFLHKQLYKHIKASLPYVRQELSKKLAMLQKILKDFSSQFGCDLSEAFSRQFYMIKLMQKFIDDLLIEVFGYSEKVPMDGLSIGSMINFKLRSSVEKIFKLPQIPDESQLLTIIANLHGMRNSMSLPALALENVANRVMSDCIDPLNNLVDDIAETLLSNVERCCMMEAYPALKNEILYFVRKSIHGAAFNTKECLQNHMRAEMYFVNTYHPDFSFPEVSSVEKFFPVRVWDRGDSGSHIVSRPKKSIPDEKAEAVEVLFSNDNMKENAHYLAKTIEKYLIIQLKLVGDTAIKYIAYFLVKTVMDFIKGELIPTVLGSPDKDSILEDCEKDFNKVKDIKAVCASLEDALNAIQAF